MKRLRIKLTFDMDFTEDKSDYECASEFMEHIRLLIRHNDNKSRQWIDAKCSSMHRSIGAVERIK